jgi:hypothetical protein
MLRDGMQPKPLVGRLGQELVPPRLADCVSERSRRGGDHQIPSVPVGL